MILHSPTQRIYHLQGWFACAYRKELSQLKLVNVRSGICQWMQITISRERERNKSIYLKLMSYMDCNCGNSCTVIAVSIILIIILTLSAPLRGIYIESWWKLATASAGRKRADRELLSQTFINLQKWLNYQWLCRILFTDL